MANDMSVQTSITTGPGKGFAGMVDGSFPQVMVTACNGEASASLAFGIAVVHDPSSPTSDFHVALPLNQTDKLRGIVAFRQGYAPAWTDNNGVVHGDLTSTGLRPGTWFGCLREGRVLVTAQKNVAPGDPLYVRAVAGVGEVQGGLENAADSTDMIGPVAGCRWDSTATAGNLAWLVVRFV